MSVITFPRIDTGITLSSIVAIVAAAAQRKGEAMCPPRLRLTDAALRIALVLSRWVPD
jgi:hypothetical protein